MRRAPVRRRRARARPLARAACPTWSLLDLSLPGARRPAGAGAGARRRAAHAGADPHRARHGGRPHPRPQHRRRRLPAQALRPRRAGGAHARAAPAPPERRAGRPRTTRSSSAACATTATAARSTTAAEVLELTPRELALLRALLAKPGHAVAKERLFELVFPGEADVQYEAIEVVVYRLRKKLARHRRAAGDAARPRLPAEGASGMTADRAPAVAAPPAAARHPAAGGAVRRDQRGEPVPPEPARRPTTAYDRTLLASAKIDRRAARRGGLRRAGRSCAPPCPTPRSRPSRPTTSSRMFYRVSALGGEMVSGFDDLPFWHGKLPDRRPYAALVDFYDDALPRRAGARGGAAAAGGQPARARHGGDPGGRDAGAARDAGAQDARRHAVAPGGAGGA